MSALALSACESTSATPPTADAAFAGACTSLSTVFVGIAENRDQGESRESQIEMAYESTDDPAAADPDGTLRYLLQTIDFVYGRPDLSAEAIEALVLDSCLVNEDGRAVLYLPQP